ncbi:ABC transporter related protein [Methanofollis liminatans DSM 4140]|uniref:ABC transporter related protein n=1 Tax=Methanofollis liminatans DSM 4140 TaxID=28892 RepID=J1L693_9EURY|nr:ABC transporter ATP-binding protein [Methanofollis liminatans]EJG08320.1 ABC transporter related protein [Methanofollis liminatans DSM 4140]
MDIITVENLQKAFKGRAVLKDITFSVKKGEVFGFLGPNGAGKTTTMRCMLGLLRPDAGEALVFGENMAVSDRLRGRIGVLLEKDGLSDRLTACENLDYYARLYGVSGRDERVREILEFVGLTERKDSLVGTFSTGMRRKLGIGRAILHNPEALFLDEPSAGLDPEAQRMVRDLIADLSREEEMTVVVNSHNLDEVQRVCSTVAILHDGRIRAFDTVERLRSGGGAEVRIVLSDRSSAERALAVLSAATGVAAVSREGEEVSARLDGADVPTLVRAMAEAGCAIEEVRKDHRSLEEIYLSVVRQAEGSA